MSLAGFDALVKQIVFFPVLKHFLVYFRKIETGIFFKIFHTDKLCVLTSVNQLSKNWVQNYKKNINQESH